MTIEEVMLLLTAIIAIYFYIQYRMMMGINKDLAAFVGLILRSRTKKEIEDGDKTPF